MVIDEFEFKLAAHVCAIVRCTVGVFERMSQASSRRSASLPAAGPHNYAILQHHSSIARANVCLWVYVRVVWRACWCESAGGDVAVHCMLCAKLDVLWIGPIPTNRPQMLS